MLEGKSMPSNEAANANHTTLLKNAFKLKLIIFKCSVNFWHQQDSNSFFRGTIGHVTS